jgi:hypothetical protein
MLWASVAIGLFTVLPAACVGGYHLGRRARTRLDEAAKSHAAAWEAALLALTGLLVGFTFSMAQTRFDARKQIILNEGNHIGTTYLRTRLLDDARGDALRRLMRGYVDARIEFTAAGGDRARAEQALRQSATLGEQIWAVVSDAARADRSPVMATLIQSTNEMLDSSEEYLASIANPMPRTVFLVLILVTAAAMAAIGYECGLEAKMRVLGMVVMPALLATVILLVFDLAHPRIGLTRVYDPILTNLKQSFENPDSAPKLPR